MPGLLPQLYAYDYIYTCILYDDDGSLPKAGSLAFTPPGDEISEVVSRCLPHRQ